MANEEKLREELTIILAKADIMFGLRNILQQVGVPKNYPLIVTFRYEDKAELQSNEIPPRTSKNYTYVGTSPVYLGEELADFLSKTELEYKLGDVLEKAGFPREGDNYISIEFKYGEGFEYKLSAGVVYCCPCFVGAPVDCWKRI